MVTIEEILPLKPKQLAARLAAGHPVTADQLAGHEYKGISLGLPAFIDKLAWKTFKKTFYHDPQTGVVRGWNLRIVQDGIHGAYVPMQKNGKPFAWGYYHVTSNAGRRAPRPAPPTALIDYGKGGNHPWELGVVFMRDPLVALVAGSADHLLGWSYFEVGPFRIPTPSYFLLIRDCPITYVAHPPR